MINSIDDLAYVKGFNPSDEFPNGDLDKIDFTYDIMPIREGVSHSEGIDKKNILVGKDIVFLLEGIAERRNWWNKCNPCVSNNPSYEFENTNKFNELEFGNCITYGYSGNNRGEGIGLASSNIRRFFPSRESVLTRFAKEFHAPSDTIVIPLSEDEHTNFDDLLGMILTYLRFNDYQAKEFPERFLSREFVASQFTELKKVNYWYDGFPVPYGYHKDAKIRVISQNYSSSGSGSILPPDPPIDGNIGYTASNNQNYSEDGYEWSYYEMWEPTESIDRTPYIFDFGKIKPNWIRFFHAAQWNEYEHRFDGSLTKNRSWSVIKEMKELPSTKSYIDEVANACGVTLKKFQPTKIEGTHCVYYFQPTEQFIYAIAEFGNHTKW